MSGDLVKWLPIKQNIHDKKTQQILCNFPVVILRNQSDLKDLCVLPFCDFMHSKVK